MDSPHTVRPGAPQPSDGVCPATPVPEAPSAEVIRASLRNSIKDAAAWSVMQGAGTNYVTPFIVLGGKGLLYLAAMAGVPALAGALVQWLAANVTDSGGQRNRLIVTSSALQALTWLPMSVAVFLPVNVGYWVMLAAFAACVGLANFSVPAWQSLMGDLVPAERRGRYFGLRAGLSGALLVVSFLGAGWWLNLCDRRGEFALLCLSGRNFGFLVLFAIAGLMRLVSAWYLHKVYEPEYRRHPSDRFSLLDFIRRAPKAHFGRFVFYCMLVNMGLGFMAPFVGWYLLDQLRFSTGEFALILAASMALSVASQPLWGRLADRIGNKRVLGIGGIGLVAVPLLVVPCQSLWQFIAVMGYEGIALGAFTIAVGNYIYDVVTPPKRARCVAYYNLFIALGTMLGAFLSALVGQFTPLPLAVAGVTVAQPFTLMLLGSALIRLLPNLLLLGSFDEFRLRRPVFGDG